MEVLPTKLKHPLAGNAAGLGRRRRLTAILVAAGAVETLAYTALTPLLPTLRSAAGLSKAQVGVLVAAYPAGVATGAIPIAALAGRIGTRLSAATSLAVLGGASVTFGVVSGFHGLVLARAVQGLAAGLCAASCAAWLVETGVAKRRAQDVGLFTSAAAFGAMFGPAIGAVAAYVGRAGVFAVIGVIAVALGAIAFAQPGPPRAPSVPFRAVRSAHGSRGVLVGHWLVAMPGFLLGTTSVLVPLQLSHLGVGAAGIAATYLVAACIGTVTRPFIGRVADRVGVSRVLAAALLLGAVVALLLSQANTRFGVAACAVVANSLFGALWGPAMAYLSHQYERVGASQALGFSLMNIPIGAGTLAGALVAGLVARAVGSGVPYWLAAGLGGATALLAVRLSCEEVRVAGSAERQVAA
jgi:predicted MFS family arabinose efflux permease